jgi:integrase
MVGSTSVDRLSPSDAGQGTNRASTRACEYDLNVFLEGQYIQDHVLTPEAFQRMLDSSPDHLKLVVQCAYYTAVRKGEILRPT